ncbi:MAG: hypothetical protein ACK4TA_08375 [Saprospiraceae bacterium]
MIQKLIKFHILVIAAIVARYYLPELFTNLFFIILIGFYARSKDEPFWLAFFFLIEDGFFSFFGLNEVLLTVIPGLPAVQFGQFYILLTLVKALRAEPVYKPFYSLQLNILFIYLIFLILQGYAVGLSTALNIQFRVLKLVLPLFLFFSLPRLMTREEQYREFFIYLIPAVFLTLLAQVITITTGLAPGHFLGANLDVEFARKATEERAYRGFYNPQLVIIAQFLALFYLAYKPKKINHNLLFAIVLSNLLAIFLSATRGWLIGFSITLSLFFLFTFSLGTKRILSLIGISLILIVSMLTMPLIRVQVNNAIERMMTLEAVVEGDLTAEGTLKRLDERAPRVMNKWRESPLTGIGFSNDFFNYGDLHVGNQNILLHSGIVGALLLLIFFLHFLHKIYRKSRSLSAEHPQKKVLLVFIVFFIGWFFIHSTSVQHFSYYQYPANGIIQAVFFSLGSLIYHIAQKAERKPKPALEDRQPVQHLVN